MKARSLSVNVRKGPRFTRAVFAVLFLAVWSAAAGLGASAIPSAGIGWDTLGDTYEEYHSANAFGAEDLDTAIEESACEEVSCSYRGLLVQQVGRVGYELATGKEKTEHSPYAIGSIRYQQVFIFVLFQVAVVAGSVAVSLRTRSPLAGMFFGALVSSIPLLAGHASMNHKDSPVASGFLLVASAMIIRSAGRGRLGLVGAYALLAGGIAIVVGQRPSSVALVLGLAGIDLFAQLVSNKTRALSHLLSRIGFWLAGLAVAGFFVFLTNPFARAGGLPWLVGAVIQQSDYPWDGQIRFAGADWASASLPVWYIPGFFWLQLPTLTTLFLTVTAILGVRRWTGQRFRRIASDPVAPIVVFSVLLPIAIAILQRPIYDSIRHVLFLLPLWLIVAVVVAAGAASGCWQSSKTWLRVAVPVAPILLLVSNLFASAQWFPYQYAYVNELATRVDGYWETDYWGLSAKEGVEKLLAQGAQEVVVVPTSGTSWWVGGRSFSHPDVKALQDGESLGIWGFARFDFSLEPYACETTAEIRRAGVLLGSGGICDYDRADGQIR